jgi:hypothetical protein
MKLFLKSLFTILWVMLYFLANSQNNSNDIQANYQLGIVNTKKPIKIDGILDDEIWKTAPVATNFWRKFPTDGGQAKRQTKVQLAYDENFFYIGVEAIDSGKAIIQSLKRDFGHDGQDGFAVLIDPQNQRTNGFFFVVSAFNSQSEDQKSETSDGLSWSWDNKWYSQTTQKTNGGWFAEMAIPFKSLRYDATKTNWGINFVRIDQKSNEYSCWTPVPVNFSSHDLGYTGKLNWPSPPPVAKSNIAVIPFITASANENKLNNQPIKAFGSSGVDAKFALNSSLNLDITVNPDFSQIEVDRQVTNLTRFNIFFPERRTFFLENDDLFSGFGIPPIRPFYSRRIGLDENANTIPILLGARLTGNIGKKTRVGFMNMQTASTATFAAENYTAATVQQRFLKRSTAKIYFLNREASLNESQKQKNPLLQYGRNIGGELSFTNLSGSWYAWSAAHKSYKPNLANDNSFINFGGGHTTRNFSFLVDVTQMGTNYYTDMGFNQRIENYDAVKDTTIRLGYKQIYNELEYKIFPKKGRYNQHSFSVNNFLVWNPNNSLNEHNISFNYFLLAKTTQNFSVRYDYSVVNLLFATAFTNKAPLPTGNYKFGTFSIGYRTDSRKDISFNANTSIGNFYNGSFTEVRGSINFRKQPNLNVSFSAQYNKLEFPSIYGTNELFLIANRVELNFNTNLFWTTFLQYNTQANNFNINSRLQWRYKPMSDLFLVYTDNYFATPFLQNKNRAIVFKMNYWLNL